MAALDGTLLHGVQRLQAGNDLTARKDADVELAAGQLAQAIGQLLGATVNGVEALREAGSQAPFDARQIGGNRRRGDGGGGTGGSAEGSLFQKITTLHLVSFRNYWERQR